MKKQKMCHITPHLQNDLVCSNSCDKMKKKKTQNTYLQNKTDFKNFEQLLTGRSSKHIFLSTNMSRKIFAIPAFVLFIVNTYA